MVAQSRWSPSGPVGVGGIKRRPPRGGNRNLFAALSETSAAIPHATRCTGLTLTSASPPWRQRTSAPSVGPIFTDPSADRFDQGPPTQSNPDHSVLVVAQDLLD